MSPRLLLRGVEVALAVALALALADLAWLLAPGPGGGNNPALSPTARTVAAGKAPAAPSGKAASRNLSPAVLGLFGRVQHGAAAPAVAVGELRETDLDLTLKGILARRSGTRKLALIAHGDAGEKVYRIGDRVAGAEITHIEARRVVLLRADVTEALTLETAEPRYGSSFASRRATEDIVDFSIQ